MAQSSEPTERIGILGGSFNPVHLAHLLVAQEAWYRLDISRVLFIPAAKNPLKHSPPVQATGAQRLKMLKLACAQDSRFTVVDSEIKRGGKSYAIDTLRALAKRYRGAELYLLLGADAALTLPKWKDIESFRDLCRVVLWNRPGSADLAGGVPDELAALGLRYEFMQIPPLQLSSSEIRRRVRQGKPVRYFVPDAVAEFIHQHSLYLTP
ncbi:nicotinate (nicotinamide) nucleotide adenylyltransferase [bacterium]|nr:nicotinate (nicotinamide) nucleotide adenylyltransferase [bacterium]